MEVDEEADTKSAEPADEETSEFYDNHPCARNEPYQWPADCNSSNIDNEEERDEEFVSILPSYDPSTPFVPPSQRDDAPLASILNPQLDGVDPRRFFIDYQPNSILRFSRLFASNIKSSSKATIWWPSRTFNSKKPSSEKEVSSTPEKKKLKLCFGPAPSAEELQADQDVVLMRAASSKPIATKSKEDVKKKEITAEDSVSSWRNGPAKIWYDMMNVPTTASKFDYGFKLKQENSIPVSPKTESTMPPLREDAFLPVNLVRWEDDIIFDGEDIRMQVLEEFKSGKQPACGWIPTQNTRTYESFIQQMKNHSFEQMFQGRPPLAPNLSVVDTDLPVEPSSSHSIFPIENCQLLTTRWEDDIIWDDQNMDRIPEPKVLTMDYYDDPLIFGMPDDRKLDDLDSQPNKPFDRKEHQFTKKSKMILGQVQQRQKREEEEQMETSLAQLTDKDPFNLSNDDYYLPKTINRSGSAGNSLLIQHSTPAQNIHRTFFPTHLNTFKLRHWHRQPLAKRIFRPFGGGNGKYVTVLSLTENIKNMEEQREMMKQAEGGGDIFFMRDVADLSGKDGELIVVEYCEEHPPLLNQPGMASKIKNYYKKRAGKDVDPDFDFGDMAFSHNVPFLGQLQPGQALQSIENNLYRAPIYRHQPQNHDFLLIRSGNGWYIRECPPLYLVGQECPLYEVPSPNSKRATAFVRDFLLAFIYRLFWASENSPRRLKMEDIKAAFPHYAESSVRKRLKLCSDFKRLGTGPDQNYWVLRPEFRLPSKEEVLAMVTPEMCCAQYSMLAAEQRLKDAGYGERYFFTPENEDDSDDGVTIEDEIKCAPWNTTRAFLSSMRGKCLLDQTGIADPTGCGQGFSYVRVSQKPQKDDTPAVPKRLVTGTNADLRKLPLKEAKEICRGYGVKEDEINALTRWEIIDVIRTLSTQAAKAKADTTGNEMSGMARFARGNIRFNFADMQEKYKKHCQHVFDLQNQTLANPEALSTDEGSSGEDSDNEEWSTRLESMLQANKGKKHISMSERARMEFENEEKERQDLKRMMNGDSKKPGEKKEVTAEEKKNVSKIGEDISQSASKISGITANQKLKIYRTIKNSDGTSVTRMEVVTRPQLIEAYTRIRTSKDDTFIQVYAQMDEQFKEERRKQKRRLQDQLRRLKKNEMKSKSGSSATQKADKKPIPIKPNLMKMRCSACHGTGHMKTNKNCPLYGKDGSAGKESTEEPVSAQGSEVVAVEGTKMKISKKFLQTHEPKKTVARPSVEEHGREVSVSSDVGNVSPFVQGKTEDDSEASDQDTSMKSRLSAGGPSFSGKRRISSMTEEEYLHGPMKSVQRIRADPRVTMGSLLTEIITELKLIPGSEHLLFPVSAKKVKDYYDIIKDPMDLQTIKNRIANNAYELRKDFLLDVKKLLHNSRLYNGDNHVITECARKMFELAGKRILEKEQQLIRLEKAINPLLDDNDRVGFCFILSEIVQKCKNVPKSVAFHTRVDPKKVPSYYEKVSVPMDLGTIEQKVKDCQYTSLQQFRDDIQQIVINSELFNGPAERSAYTSKAVEIGNLATQLIDEKAVQLSELEANILGVDTSFTGDADIESDMDIFHEDRDVLNDDLALSGNEIEDEDEVEWGDLLQSQMHTAGQLNNDLALSDSDDEEHVDALKRPANDDNLLDSF